MSPMVPDSDRILTVTSVTELMSAHWTHWHWLLSSRFPPLTWLRLRLQQRGKLPPELLSLGYNHYTTTTMTRRCHSREGII